MLRPAVRRATAPSLFHVVQIRQWILPDLLCYFSVLCRVTHTALEINAADKQSANCRLEANYAHESEVDMIPLMCEKDYRPKGWLGLMLGTRLWYPLFDCDDDDEAAFESRVASIAKEIGQRARAPAVAAPISRPSPQLMPRPQQVPAPTAAATSEHGRSMPASHAVTVVEEAVPPSPAAVRMQVEPVRQREAALAPSPSPAALAFDDSFSPSLHQSSGGDSSSMSATEVPGLLQLVQQQQEALQGTQVALKVSALQFRLAAMHTARLLTEETLHTLEDLLADVAEVRCSRSHPSSAAVSPDPAQLELVVKLDRLIGVSEAMSTDASFARQIQRKFMR